ncbi:hypothetical protein ANN_03527 [Periplaneta americana]|uniref:Uncharacterized protein n=1 Tax=Periplaneta americana TaxID=6978 RepID=A0ABQ8U3F7_PERAM|nr:hypothetical protein ANN_03527 [Periplaneta americana]
MSPGSSTESYPAFARIGLRENPGKNLNQVTCPDRDSNPGHLVSQPDALTVTPQVWTTSVSHNNKEDDRSTRRRDGSSATEVEVGRPRERLNTSRWAYVTTMWDPRTGKRTAGRPRVRWRNFFRREAGRHWTRTATCRTAWEMLGSAESREDLLWILRPKNNIRIPWTKWNVHPAKAM